LHDRPPLVAWEAERCATCGPDVAALVNFMYFTGFLQRATLLTLVFAGNNYSIANESGTKNARIFFAQGCEVEPEMSSQES
jgi:hypothetical protein